MEVKRNGKWEYVPDILFEADGCEEPYYKDVQDYIDTTNELENAVWVCGDNSTYKKKSSKKKGHENKTKR